MAPALTSNSFLPTTTHRSRRQALKNPKPTFRFFAKQKGPFPPFRIGKQEEEDSNQTQGSKPKTPFFFDIKVPDAKSLVPVLSKPSTSLFIGNQRRKDPQTVFVAGATGQSGIRIAQTLLRQGFAVRAGVPALAAAQELARLAATYKIISSQESKRLNAVESTFQDAEAIAKAIGNAGKVVVTIGPEENGPTSEVTTADALQVIQAAQLSGVTHVAVVYDSSSPSMSSTYNVLDGISSFFSNIFSRSQPPTVTEFLAKVVETDISYTFIKATVTEDYSTANSYNVVVSPEGSAGANDYKVSKSQMASLVADVFSNTSVAENKVVEVSTSPSAPSKPIEELFSAIPEDGRRKAYAEAQAKAKVEEEALRASERARKAAEAAKKLEEEVKKLSKKEEQAASLAAEAQEKAEAAGSSLEGLLNRAKNIGGGFSWEKLNSQRVASEKEEATVEAPEKAEASGSSLESFLNRAKDVGGGFSWEKLSSQISVQKSIEKPKTQIATVRGVAKARTLLPKKAVIKQTSSKPKPKPKSKSEEPKTEVKNVFGGLFKQEVIYMDDD